VGCHVQLLSKNAISCHTFGKVVSLTWLAFLLLNAQFPAAGSLPAKHQAPVREVV
jgi:hypothetical protein